MKTIKAIFEIGVEMARDLWASAKDSDYGVMAICFVAGVAAGAIIAILF